MPIDFLHHQPLEKVTQAFNKAFENYFLPVNEAPADLARRMKRDDLKLELSTGVFEGDKIVGLMLQGGREEGGKKILYNGGTGVVQAARGQGLTLRQYDWAIPRLKDQGFSTLKLEVIRENAPAIHVYQKVGFEIVRELDSFVGHVGNFLPPKGIKVIMKKRRNWESQDEWQDYLPSWQHADASLQNVWPEVVAFEARTNDGKKMGYIASLPNGRIMQFAVAPDHRRAGIGRALFSAVHRQLKGMMLNVINVERMSQPLDQFFIALGMNPGFYQYEMEMEL